MKCSIVHVLTAWYKKEYTLKGYTFKNVSTLYILTGRLSLNFGALHMK